MEGDISPSCMDCSVEVLQRHPLLAFAVVCEPEKTRRSVLCSDVQRPLGDASGGASDPGIRKQSVYYTLSKCVLHTFKVCQTQ